MLKTGIRELDSLIGGGIPEGSTVLIIGDALSHYRLLAESIAHSSVSSGLTCLYATADRFPMEILTEMKFYGLDVSNLPGRLLFLDFASSLLPEGFEEERRDLSLDSILPRTLEDLLELMIRERGSSGLCTIVDNLASLILADEGKDPIKFLRLLRSQTRALNAISIILLPKGVLEENIVEYAQHLANGIIEMYSVERGEVVENFIRVSKMEGTTPQQKAVRYTVTYRGLALETVRRIL